MIFFWVKRCDTNFQNVRDYTSITHVPHFYEIVEFIINGFVYTTFFSITLNVGATCETSRPFPSRYKMTATHVELHNFRGLYVLMKRGGGVRKWVILTLAPLHPFEEDEFRH